jgi:hypothetical protein
VRIWVDDGLPLAGGALTLEVPHPLIARRTWHVRTKPYMPKTNGKAEPQAGL